MEADQRQALVQQGKALKAQLAELEVRLQQQENRLQVRILHALHTDEPDDGCCALCMRC